MIVAAGGALVFSMKKEQPQENKINNDQSSKT